MGNSVIIDHDINVFCAHASLDVLLHIVKYTCINIAGFLDAGNLLRRFQHREIRHFVAFFFVFLYLFFNGQMAFAISFAAAAPTW